MKQADRDLVAHAIACINCLVKSEFHLHREAWIKAWYEYDLKWSEGDPAYVTIPQRWIGHFVEQAREERVIFDLACFFVRTRSLAAVAMPDDMRSFAHEVSTGVVPKPHGRPGRPSTWGRNFIIIRTMMEINPGCLFDGEDARCPTARLDQRGVRRRELSATEIVYEALQRTEIGLVDRKSINEIWSSKKWQAAHDEAYSLFLGGQLDDLDDVARI
jgi:hypothetical protein